MLLRRIGEFPRNYVIDRIQEKEYTVGAAVPGSNSDGRDSAWTTLVVPVPADAVTLSSLSSLPSTHHLDDVVDAAEKSLAAKTNVSTKSLCVSKTSKDRWALDLTRAADC